MSLSVVRPIKVWRYLAIPFYCLLFLYFFVVSAEMLNIKIALFKFKLNALVGIVTFGLFFLHIRLLRLDRDFLAVALGCLGSMLISALFGYHLIACLGFVFFFVFNYFVFFVFPVNLFRVYDAKRILNIYFFSFIPVGLYATAQVIFSFVGIRLPFVTQVILTISRGQGFSYEPSYYALYMTPFSIFYTAKFLLQEKRERNLKHLLGANVLLLVSTSAGCLFSYVALFFCLASLKVIKLIRKISVFELLWKSMIAMTIMLSTLWYIKPSVVTAGFLKLFSFGILKHATFECRWQLIQECWEIFWDHPFLGTGLGGMAKYYIQKHGLLISQDDPDILNFGIASNVSMEVLASLGILGILAFCGFFFTLWKNSRNTLRIPDLTSEERINVLSLIISLCVMFFTLQFSQSIMRAYTWLHVGVCVGYFKYLQSKYRYQKND
jgi:hypothetical protein